MPYRDPEAQKAACKRWQRSPQGRAALRAYQHTAGYREQKRKWHHTEKGQEKSKRGVQRRKQQNKASQASATKHHVRWDQEQDIQLARYVAQGLCCSAIAPLMNRSVVSISQRKRDSKYLKNAEMA